MIIITISLLNAYNKINNTEMRCAFFSVIMNSEIKLLEVVDL